MTTNNPVQESPEKEVGFLSSEEQAIFSQITTKEPPYSQRAQALLAVDEGATQVEAGRQAGLTQGQVRYWLAKFRRDGIDIFPEELLNQAQPETQADTPDVQDSEQPQNEEDAQSEMLDIEKTTGPVGDATVQPKDKAKSKKKSKKKPKNKSKKAKKRKKAKKEKKSKKSSKKNKSPKKAGNKKGKSGKKKGKSR